jgi:hypothetical protein
MLDDRSDERIEYITKCELDIRGTIHKCLLYNLSATGASVEMTSSDQNYIQEGEIGMLTVLLSSSPVKYLCTVVRVKSTQICLQFLDDDDRT